MILSLFYVITFSFYLLSHFNRIGLYVIAFSFYLLSRFDRTGLYVIAFNFYLLSHVIDLDSMLSLSVFVISL